MSVSLFLRCKQVRLYIPFYILRVGDVCASSPSLTDFTQYDNF